MENQFKLVKLRDDKMPNRRGGSVEVFRPLALEGTKPDTINSCFYIKGENLRKYVEEMIMHIHKRTKLGRYEICHQLTSQLGSEKSTMLKYFRERKHFPVYLLNILISRLSKRKQEIYRSLIQRGVEFFKFGTSATWIKFPKRLNRELSWLSGAVAADGWVTKEPTGKERLGVVDQNLSALEVARQSFETAFGYTPSIKRHKTEDCYLLIVDSKAVVRFFTTFLGFGYGKKAETIHEPPIIKSSHYRLDFAKGVMSFDGSVELDGTVSIGVKSKKLIDDLYEIFNENGFELERRKCSHAFSLRSPYLSGRKDTEKWVSIFGSNTTKGNRLSFLITGKGELVSSEEEALRALEEFVRKKPISKASISEVFQFAKKKNYFTKYELMKEFKIAHATFWKYVLILRKAKILISENKTGRGISNHYIFNPKSEEWTLPPMVF